MICIQDTPERKITDKEKNNVLDRLLKNDDDQLKMRATDSK